MSDINMGKGSSVEAGKKDVGPEVIIGDEVRIICEELILGEKVRIGATESEKRLIEGIDIKCKKLSIGDGATIRDGTSIRGGSIKVGSGTSVNERTQVNVAKIFSVGHRSIIGQNMIINGVDVRLGHEFWSDSNVIIGGGSCFEVHSRLRIGDFGHLGYNVYINTARSVEIGHEVGLGTRTALYTHGAYQSAMNGFPVKFAPIKIGDNSWLPGAIVNPGITIGKNVVVGVGSVVTNDLPDGCLAAGIPARIIKQNAYPSELEPGERYEFMIEFMSAFAEILDANFDKSTEVLRIGLPDTAIIYMDSISSNDIKELANDARTIIMGYKTQVENISGVTIFNISKRGISGIADEISERLKNQLRRYGIRFRFSAEAGKYEHWKD
jgi:acetyltransferase-like isoleucine patch superfamily enzyme